MRISWDEQKVWKFAATCSGMTDYRSKYGGSYPFLKRSGLLSKLREYFHVKPVMNDELAFARVASYSSYQDFREHEVTAYQYLRKRGLLSKATRHLYRKGDLLHRAIYVFEFSTHAAYIGLSKDPRERCAHHLQRVRSSVYQYLKATNADYEFKVLTGFLNAYDAAVAERDTIKKYADGGWKIINKVDGGSLGFSPKRKYSLDYMIERASHYANSGEFREKETALYHYAERHGELEAVIAHCKHPHPRKAKRSYDDILTVAKTYPSKFQFRNGADREYKFAWRHGWLESITSACIDAGVWKRQIHLRGFMKKLEC